MVPWLVEVVFLVGRRIGFLVGGFVTLKDRLQFFSQFPFLCLHHFSPLIVALLFRGNIFLLMDSLWDLMGCMSLGLSHLISLGATLCYKPLATGVLVSFIECLFSNAQLLWFNSFLVV